MATKWETAMQAKLDEYKDDPVKLAALYRMYPDLQSNQAYSAGYTPEVKAAGDRYQAQRSFEPGVVTMTGGSVVPRTAKPIENADDAYLYLGKDAQQAIRDATGYTGNFTTGDWSEFANWFSANGGDWNALNHAVVNAARAKQSQYIGSDKPGYGFTYDQQAANYHWPNIYDYDGNIAIPGRYGDDPYFGAYDGLLFPNGQPGATGGSAGAGGAGGGGGASGGGGVGGSSGGASGGSGGQPSNAPVPYYDHLGQLGQSSGFIKPYSGFPEWLDQLPNMENNRYQQLYSYQPHHAQEAYLSGLDHWKQEEIAKQLGYTGQHAWGTGMANPFQQWLSQSGNRNIYNSRVNMAANSNLGLSAYGGSAVPDFQGLLAQRIANQR